MSQGIISLQITDDQLAGAQDALTQLETLLSGLISLEAEDRRRLNKMGPKSEYFCRQTLNVLQLNPQIVPPSLDVAGAQTDLQALERLRPLLGRLQRLAERGADTETALGADLMDFALEGYGLLKVSGKNQGLDGLRKELSGRWAKTRREPAPPVP
ncbi:hypothetical protein LVB77_09980 [Lysobacter sp. 5GHs7-4]|uniref:hypothetical protein n=1 Tax=Lysobacter sp. 5GHs7-4 TaxID=2904253 RepID=UPI001E315618|nr:hypothetical protein [Lysobacter sp. 5GHs7-4]UHQ24970.1 hypothetical protein LVB77_09980 [Lysobacter sp. 5GHs7-4]